MNATLGGYAEFAAAFAVDFATHMAPMRPTVRRHPTAALGRRGVLAAYSLQSMSGAFAVFAQAGMSLIDRRRRRDVGEAAWRRAAAATSAWPCAGR